MHKSRILFLILFLALGSFVFAQKELTLEKVTVVSRHNVRAPLEKYLNTLDEMTGDGYQWTRWSVPGGNLTLRGGALEMLFGEYFRLWLQNEHFLLCPQNEEFYFGASPKQRTIATARAFAAGMLPYMNVPVDYKVDETGKLASSDPDYLPLLNDYSASNGEFKAAAFREEADRELGQLEAPSYTFLEKVLRMESSSYTSKKSGKHFDKKVEVCLDFYKKDGDRAEPTMQGGLKDANMASDAFILQYYEMADSIKAAFGHQLSFDEWKSLASIKDIYGDILFTRAPIISVNVSHCMLSRLQSEMLAGGHKFAFFCTHDSMIAALLAALRVKPYKLPNTIETQTPIGVKLLFEQWKETCSDNPHRYVRVRLLYQSSDQIRKMTPMDLSNPPMSYELSFEGLEKASNGMYKYDDFMKRLQESIQAYDETAQGNHPWKRNNKRD